MRLPNDIFQFLWPHAIGQGAELPGILVGKQIVGICNHVVLVVLVECSCICNGIIRLLDAGIAHDIHALGRCELKFICAEGNIVLQFFKVQFGFLAE